MPMSNVYQRGSLYENLIIEIVDRRAGHAAQ